MSVDIEAVVRENIDATVHLSLATVSENKPWVCEVHFAYDDQLNLYFRSLKSRRHSQEIAENQNVSGNIVKQYGLGEQVLGIYFEGTAELLTSEADKVVAFKSLRQRLQADDSILEESNRDDGHQFYKITVTDWYVFGTFDGAGQKLKLDWNKA